MFKKPILGFSLIELLVVIFILSMIATVAIPTLSENKEQRVLISEAEKILVDLRFNQRKAEFESIVIKFILHQNYYKFFTIRNDEPSKKSFPKNNEVIDENVERTLDKNINLTLLRKDDLNANKLEKEIMFFGDGQYTPFDLKLELEDTQSQIWIKGNGLNPIKIDKK